MNLQEFRQANQLSVHLAVICSCIFDLPYSPSNMQYHVDKPLVHTYACIGSFYNVRWWPDPNTDLEQLVTPYVDPISSVNSDTSKYLEFNITKISYMFPL